ncbi:phage tail terminator protein [Komagataeibacter nataicola]|uniref:phage tail terminator protein n=2 Tax=Komagataeibacter nataicola TaxID=265960 RepID=UPI0011B37C00|nr:hypothetical protein [Komagataeibacter nataicola]WNM07316.1 hypothetical protein RI056_00295 [Komagataeibacter nataicola]
MGTFTSPVDVAQQIDSQSKIFVKNQVGLEAELARLLDETALNPTSLPFACVIFTGTDVEENRSLTSVITTQTLSFGVFVVLDNRADNTGGTAQQINYTTCSMDLRSCLCGWVPSDRALSPGITGGSGEYVKMTASRIVYKFDFEVTEQILPEDGFSVDYDPLTEMDIEGDYYKDGELVDKEQVTITK